MPIIYSPVSEDPLGPPRSLHPGKAFIICQQSDVPVTDRQIVTIAENTLRARNFGVINAMNSRRTGDYFLKIVDHIRGTGFCLCVYSEETRQRTVANIFLEIGMALLLGKPIIIIKDAAAPIPSDLQRSDVISYDGDDDDLTEQIHLILDGVTAGAEFLVDIANWTRTRPSFDWETIFHRYLQAVLINKEPGLVEQLGDVVDQVSVILDEHDPDPTLQRIVEEMNVQVGQLKRSLGMA